MCVPSISVVVPCFNHGCYLKRLVDSVRCACSDGIRVQIIIVDDGSTDDSLSVAYALADRFPEVEVVSKPNGGLSSARNAGIARCRGEFVHFLDADDHVLPLAYRTWLDFFREQPDLDAAYGGYLVQDQMSGTTSQVTSHSDASTVNKVLRERNLWPPHAVMLRAAVVARIGTFDESLVACEDWDYWVRASRLGVRYGRIGMPLVVYDRPANSMSRSFRRMMIAATTVRRRAKSIDNASDVLNRHEKRVLAREIFWDSCGPTMAAMLARRKLVPVADIVDILRVEPLAVDALIRFALAHKRLIVGAVWAGLVSPFRSSLRSML